MSFKPSGEAIVGSEIQKETLLQKNHLYVDKTTKTMTIPVTRFPYQQVVLPLGYKSNQFKLQLDMLRETLPWFYLLILHHFC